MNEIYIILAILEFIWIGYVLLKVFSILRESDIISTIVYSFAVGTGFISFQLFGYSILHISWNPINIYVPWVILTLIYIIQRRRFFNYYNILATVKQSFKTKISNVRFTPLELVFITLISILILFTAFESILRPVSNWDAWTQWLYRAKIFFIDNTVDPSVFSYLNNDYPFVLNLIATHVYMMLGTIDDTAILLFFNAYYLFLALFFFVTLKKATNRTWALIFTFLLISLQILIRHGGRYDAGDADLPLAFYFFTSVVLLIKYVHSKKVQDLLLFSLVTSIASLIKFEGIPFLIIMDSLVLIFMLKNTLFKQLSLLVSSLLPLIIWSIYSKINNIPKHAFLDDKVHIANIPEIIHGIFNEFVHISNWHLLWIVFGLTCLLFIFAHKKIASYHIFGLITLMQLSSYFFTFLVDTIPPQIHIPNVIDRLFIHLAPLATFFIAYVLFNERKMITLFRKKSGK